VATVIGIAVGLLVVALGLWIGSRRADKIIGPQLAQALGLDKTDPVAARRLMDDYFTRRATQDQRERAVLWQQAPNDLKAAKQLRKRLMDDLVVDAAGRREFKDLNQGTPQLSGQIDESEQQARAQIARLDQIIEHLQGR